MKHLGDISKINGADIEPVDIISFGSPCQDLSISGKRAGIREGTRSGLFMEAVRIIREMREATNGKYPNFAIWENVPGSLNSNGGNDFRLVCEELIKIAEPGASMPPVPPRGWATADSHVGDGWSLAYRVFDSQYWGVAQRRKRLYLIFDFRAQRSRSILFERAGLRGHSPQGRKEREIHTARAQGGSGGESPRRVYVINQLGGQFERWKETQTGDTLCAANNAAVAYETDEGIVIRRFTPTECARLQGFPDNWGAIEPKESFTDSEFAFWLDVRNTHAAINGRTQRTYTRESMLKWYNKLHSYSAECKMWGNGIALPTALYCMEGIAEALNA